jgi:hypothetical protein
VFCNFSCDRLLSLLFHETAQHLCINFSRVRTFIQKGVVEQIAETVRWSVRMRCPNLTRLDLSGGSAHMDKEILRSLEKLCLAVSRNAPNIREVRLQVGSNMCCNSLSYCPKLQVLVFERTRHLDRRGFRDLSHARSKTRLSLLSFHVGVFRQTDFDKTDVTEFFVSMRRLRSFSCFDEERLLFRLDLPRGDKVLTYSVIRLAIVDAERGAIPGYNYSRRGPYRSHLRDIKVVDRQLKPKYLLQTCPALTSLYLDWQLELSEPPYTRYPPDWFSQMIRAPDWYKLSEKLVQLHVVFPAAHSPNAYSLNHSDFAGFFACLGGLKKLKLVGGGNGAPLPLLEILEKCPDLEELVLDKCGIYIPPGSFGLRRYSAMRRFSLVRSGESIVFNKPVLAPAICHLFPRLEQLEIQPEAVTGFLGLSPAEFGQERDSPMFKNYY